MRMQSMMQKLLTCVPSERELPQRMHMDAVSMASSAAPHSLCQDASKLHHSHHFCFELHTKSEVQTSGGSQSIKTWVPLSDLVAPARPQTRPFPPSRTRKGVSSNISREASWNPFPCAFCLDTLSLGCYFLPVLSPCLQASTPL